MAKLLALKEIVGRNALKVNKTAEIYIDINFE